ncbi:MAG: OsmC family protein [Anaerolineales bacterium]|nr:OsmC family protein [Anaerolineales bacterium]
MQAKVIWKGDMGFVGQADTGFTVDLDAAAAVGGHDGGFRPMELMAISLAGCTAMDVISILKKKRQTITGFDVRVDADQAGEHPHAFTSAAITYAVVGHEVQEDAVRRAMELSAVRYCPAQSMLSQVMPIVLNYEIYEDEGENQHSMKIKGVLELNEQ